MAVERRRIHFGGRVQGVGFRFTAARLAPGFDVSGSVRNLPDGRVELEVQGEPEQIRSLLDALRGEMGSKIREVSESPLLVDPEESPGAFEIRT